MSTPAEVAAFVATVDGINRAYVDKAPEDEAAYPVAVVHFAANGNPESRGDGRWAAWRHAFTVTVWQRWELDDEMLPIRVATALRTFAPTGGFQLRIRSTSRTPDAPKGYTTTVVSGDAYMLTA